MLRGILRHAIGGVLLFSFLASAHPIHFRNCWSALNRPGPVANASLDLRQIEEALQTRFHQDPEVLEDFLVVSSFLLVGISEGRVVRREIFHFFNELIRKPDATVQKTLRKMAKSFNRTQRKTAGWIKNLWRSRKQYYFSSPWTLLRLARESILVALVTIPAIYPQYAQLASVVKGNSSYPTVQDRDRVVLDPLSVEPFEWNPDYGDFVTLEYSTEYDYIKRVVGKPGDHILIANGKLYRNGKEVEEAYVAGRRTDRENHSDIVLRADEYYVMGDNRPNSGDSREFGPVHRSKIYGKVRWLLREH